MDDNMSNCQIIRSVVCKNVANSEKKSVANDYFLIFMPLNKNNMEKQVKFAPNVMLLDASFLDRVSTDIAGHFSQVIGRELAQAQLADLLEYMALDAGIPVGENEVQVFFIYNGKASAQFHVLVPASLESEIDGKAFKGKLGEFSLYAYQPLDMATTEDLFLETLELVIDSKEVKHITAVPDEMQYAEKAVALLNKAEKKYAVVLMGMNPPVTEFSHRFETLGFPLLQALGVRPDEL